MLEDIATNAFNGSPKLQNVVLSGNKFSQFPVFSNKMKELTVLNLNLNSITVDSFEECDRLESLGYQQQ